MKTVITRTVEIGSGRPKICVPIVGKTKQGIIDEAKTFQNIPVDVVEWRADWFEHIFTEGAAEDVLRELRLVLEDIPILFTFRTSKEGGEKEIGIEAYVSLNKRIIKSGLADLVDMEVFTGDAEVREVIEAAHNCGVYIVASNHDFDQTPGQDEIVSRLCKMQDLGADICKMAVMPKTKKDVLVLLCATEEMVTNYADRPVITMSMAGLGVISRLAGEIFGSALTFGAAKKASAPGQIGVNDLHDVLKLLHSSL